MARQAAPAFLVLAAGRGNRMGHLTASSPKCLVELDGRSLLDWQVTAAHGAGMTAVTVVTGYRENLLRSEEFSTVSNPLWHKYEMVHSLFVGLSAIDSSVDVVVSYSDIVFTAAPLATLIASTGGLSITVDMDWSKQWSARFSDPLDDAEELTFEEKSQRLLTIGRRPVGIEKIHGQYMGLLIIRSAARRRLEELWIEIDDYSLQMTAFLNLALESGIEIGVAPVRGNWFEIDSVSDLEVATQWVGDGRLRLSE